MGSAIRISPLLEEGHPALFRQQRHDKRSILKGIELKLEVRATFSRIKVSGLSAMACFSTEPAARSLIGFYDNP
jgi:hypothetical protein